MNKYKTMDANEAVSNVSYNFTEIAGIYPITPASTMAEKVDILSNSGKKNFFGERVKVTEMQSEAGAIALVHGALQAGTLATTYTASQGLLLMIPSLYKMAGEMLPGVVHVAARSLSTHALSIFGDHQDVYAVRNTGVCMLCSSSPSEARDMANIAHLSAIKASLPFVNFFDGFRTSHQIDKIRLLDDEKIKGLIDFDALNKFRKRGINPNKPDTRGTAQNEDIYFQNTEARNGAYESAKVIVKNYMDEFNGLFGTNYKPFNYYGDVNADSVIIAMGSVCGTIRETIDDLNGKGNKYGLIEVHLFRPFSTSYLKGVLPDSVKRIAVLDRSKEFGAVGEALYMDVNSALSDTGIMIIGGRYGLSSKNVDPAQIKAVYDFLNSDRAHHNFTVGINDDVTHLSIPVDETYKLNICNTEFLIYGYGSDGMVSTSKDIIRIIGDYTDSFVQGYFQYDSKKSGGVTRSHIKISDREILGAYYVSNPSLIVVSKDTYLYKYDILDNICDGGSLIVNTDMEEEVFLSSLPNRVKYLLAKKGVHLFVIDAYKLVNELGLKNKISTCMEICIFKIINRIDVNRVREIIKDHNVKRFSHKGQDVIDSNNRIVERALDCLRGVDVPDDFIDAEVEDRNKLNFMETINGLKGDSLPVSCFMDKKSGIFEGGTTKSEKRDIAEMVPCWNGDNCIQCNRCAFVCPHGVIRPFLTKEDRDSIKCLNPKDVFYKIGISYKDCTGCGLCVNNCPGKMGEKALEMVNYNRDIYREDEFLYLLDNNVNDMVNKKILNVRNVGFEMPKFEFSGACGGCGETPYIKNLTQVFGNSLVIANATGCSSIYGASVPSMPYSVSWANSLFEDNAEFGLGILSGIMNKRNVIREYMLNNRDEIFDKWLSDSDNVEVCMEVEREIDFNKHRVLNDYRDFITPKSMWIIGGDGFAYDIGFGGLDHILSTNNNFNVMVLDTEVYSNTGGQSSKSSNLGSIASFTASGKENFKKDLARVAMCYPHVYVACCNIGYDKEQYLRALKEANSYNGPSIIICYAPCIEHGIKRGMEHSLDDAYLATKCGYFLTFRYNPLNGEFYMDSKDVDFDLYYDFLKGENRFNSLDEDKRILLDKQRDWAIKRYNYYKNLEENCQQ